MIYNCITFFMWCCYKFIFRFVNLLYSKFVSSFLKQRWTVKRFQVLWTIDPLLYIYGAPPELWLQQHFLSSVKCFSLWHTTVSELNNYLHIKFEFKNIFSSSTNLVKLIMPMKNLLFITTETNSFWHKLLKFKEFAIKQFLS